MEKSRKKNYSLWYYRHVLMTKLHPQLIILIQESFFLLNLIAIGVLIPATCTTYRMSLCTMTVSMQLPWSTRSMNIVLHLFLQQTSNFVYDINAQNWMKQEKEQNVDSSPVNIILYG